MQKTTYTLHRQRVNVETESPGTLTRERFNVILVVFFLHYLVNGVMQAIWN